MNFRAKRASKGVFLRLTIMKISADLNDVRYKVNKFYE